MATKIEQRGDRFVVLQHVPRADFWMIVSERTSREAAERDAARSLRGPGGRTYVDPMVNFPGARCSAVNVLPLKD